MGRIRPWQLVNVSSPLGTLMVNWACGRVSEESPKSSRWTLAGHYLLVERHLRNQGTCLGIGLGPVARSSAIGCISVSLIPLTTCPSKAVHLREGYTGSDKP